MDEGSERVVITIIYEPGRIASAVAAPPDDWGISTDERIALCVFLDRRRAELLQRLSRPSGGLRWLPTIR